MAYQVGPIGARGKVTITLLILAAIAVALYYLGIIPKDIFKRGAPTKIEEAARTGDQAFDDAFQWNIGVNTWIGYAGGAYANGGFAPNPNSIFWQKYRTKVNLVWMDDPQAVRNAWKSDRTNLHMYWQTLDAFTTEVSSLVKDYEPKVTFLVDYSRGGDVCVAAAGITRVDDLIGKKVSLALGVPSHTLFLRMLEAAGIASSEVNYGPGTNPEKINVVGVPSPIEAVQYFKTGQVDAAVIWAPDDESCLMEVTGSRILWSTAKSRNSIADVLIAKKADVDAHQEELKGLISGWLEGNAIVNSDTAAMSKAIEYLAAGFNNDAGFFRAISRKARLATFGDNINFFLNINYPGMTGQRLYYESGSLFAKAGAAPATLPDWRIIVDTRALRAVQLSGPQNAAEGEVTFTPPTAAEAKAPAVATKQVVVEFAINSAVLDDVAKARIDREFVPIALANSGNRVRIEGNTDNTGSDAINGPLSYNRALAVKQYLVTKHRFDPRRFIVIGNGSSNPLAGNANATAEERRANRRTEFQLLP